MKKIWITAVILVLLAMTPACGNGSGEPTPAADETAATGDTSPTATKLVYATPTPLPPPPTPTPIPPTDTPIPPPPTDTPEPPPTPAAGETQTPTDTPAPPTPTPTPAPKSQVTDMMVEIPAGPFTMGSDAGDPEDAPAHQVDLPAYEIDQFEVTNADYATFAGATGYETYAEGKGFMNWRDAWTEGKDNHPVVMVTWEDANAYCEWLGKRLPTEAEWEKAARGTDARRFPWGDDWDPNKANVKARGLRGTSVVGSFGEGASPFGIHDTIGNVWEWTANWYQPYPGNGAGDPYYGETYRVTRGGGWFDEEPQATTFNRNAGDPAKTANDDVGFRCAR